MNLLYQNVDVTLLKQFLFNELENFGFDFKCLYKRKGGWGCAGNPTLVDIKVNLP